MRAVSTSIGVRSRYAWATAVTRLLTPGPSVATSTPGVRVRCATASAMKPPGVSCFTRWNAIPARASASITASTSPPGIPKA